MSTALSIIFYSKYCSKSTELLSFINNPDDYIFLCVDNIKIKNQILNDSKLNIRIVPTLLIVSEDGNFIKYENDDILDWVQENGYINENTIPIQTSIPTPIQTSIPTPINTPIQPIQTSIPTPINTPIQTLIQPINTPIQTLIQPIETNLPTIMEEDDQEDDNVTYNPKEIKQSSSENKQNSISLMAQEMQRQRDIDDKNIKFES